MRGVSDQFKRLDYLFFHEQVADSKLTEIIEASYKTVQNSLAAEVARRRYRECESRFTTCMELFIGKYKVKIERRPALGGKISVDTLLFERISD